MRILCGQVALVVLMAWALPTAAQPAWEVVTSKEGGFTVEMPTKPAPPETARPAAIVAPPPALPPKQEAARLIAPIAPSLPPLARGSLMWTALTN